MLREFWVVTTLKLHKKRILGSYNIKRIVTKREFWVVTTLKLHKNLFWLWIIFFQNLRILCRKNKNQTLSIPSRAMTVIRSTSDRQNVSLEHVYKSTKKQLPFQERIILLCRSTRAKQITRLRGIILKLLLPISDTIKDVVWKLGTSIAPTLLWIVTTEVYYRMHTCILLIDDVTIQSRV